MGISGIGTSTGKIILMGEHSAVYGEPSLVMPFPHVNCTVEIKKNNRDTNWIECAHFKGAIADLPTQFASIAYLIHLFINKFGLFHSIDLIIRSDIPLERGMGSSAGVGTAITRAFYDYMDIPLKREALLNYVNQSEKIAHGNPSGMDAFATSSNKIVCFENRKFSTYLPLKMDSVLIVAESGIKGNTRTAIKKVKYLVDHDKTSTEEKIKQLGNFTRRAKESLIENDPINLGHYFNRAHTVLKDLSISLPFIDDIIGAALNSGALGAKLTGSGLGGSIIALAKSKNDAEKVSNQLLEKGVRKVWQQPLDL